MYMQCRSRFIDTYCSEETQFILTTPAQCYGKSSFLPCLNEQVLCTIQVDTGTGRHKPCINAIPFFPCNTRNVEPVLSGIMWSGHATKSVKLRKWILLKLSLLNVPCIKRHGHLLHGFKPNFSVFWNCVKRSVERWYTINIYVSNFLISENVNSLFHLCWCTVQAIYELFN